MPCFLSLMSSLSYLNHKSTSTPNGYHQLGKQSRDINAIRLRYTNIPTLTLTLNVTDNWLGGLLVGKALLLTLLKQLGFDCGPLLSREMHPVFLYTIYATQQHAGPSWSCSQSSELVAHRFCPFPPSRVRTCTVLYCTTVNNGEAVNLCRLSFPIQSFVFLLNLFLSFSGLLPTLFSWYSSCQGLRFNSLSRWLSMVS
jgi:hypothetical protein